MHFTFFALMALAIPAITTSSMTKRADVHCGTTSDATLSDCRKLTQNVDLWNSVYTESNICHFTNVLANVYDYPVFNVACHNNCCVYVAGPSDRVTKDTTPGADKDTLRKQAHSLLGCADVAANKVNGMAGFGNHHVCLSNGKGCSDCFDDADFSFGS